VQEIQQANCLPGTLIVAGKPLYLPSSPVRPSTNTPPPSSTTEIPPPEPPVDEPTAPPPGDPRVQVIPFKGTIPTEYTFQIKDFDPGEIVTVEIILNASDFPIIDTFSITVDSDGNLDAPWTSQLGNPIGSYFVKLTGGNGVNSAVGELEIIE
jgi:hypothetical protein